MLIRSQDKSQLINFNNTRELRFLECTQGFSITDCVCSIGHYSTKSKAMKVLDMIQKRYEEYETERIYKEGVFKIGTFQMPEDSEVEA